LNLGSRSLSLSLSLSPASLVTGGIGDVSKVFLRDLTWLLDADECLLSPSRGGRLGSVRPCVKNARSSTLISIGFDAKLLTQMPTGEHEGAAGRISHTKMVPA
jgi:hypothetical protein